MLKQSGRAGQRLSNAAQCSQRSQRGVVLLVALIILVALTLAGVALIRSVDTANLIAGNQAFHQSAVHAGEQSTEAAITWLVGANPPPFATAPTDANPATGYLAARDDRIVTAGVPETWDAFWARTVGVTPAVTAAPDAAGNTVSYVIHRLCGQPGPPQNASTECAKPPTIGTGGTQQAGNTGNMNPISVYYRITTRVQGPRNTVAYIQTIVVL